MTARSISEVSSKIADLGPSSRVILLIRPQKVLGRTSYLTLPGPYPNGAHTSCISGFATVALRVGAALLPAIAVVGQPDPDLRVQYQRTLATTCLAKERPAAQHQCDRAERR